MFIPAVPRTGGEAISDLDRTATYDSEFACLPHLLVFTCSHGFSEVLAEVSITRGKTTTQSAAHTRCHERE